MAASLASVKARLHGFQHITEFRAGWPAAHGEKAAVDEYFADKPERPISLITGQALVLKIPSMH